MRANISRRNSAKRWPTPGKPHSIGPRTISLRTTNSELSKKKKQQQQQQE